MENPRTKWDIEAERELKAIHNIDLELEYYGCKVGDWVMLPDGDIGRVNDLFVISTDVSLEYTIRIEGATKFYKAPLYPADPQDIVKWRKKNQ